MCVIYYNAVEKLHCDPKIDIKQGYFVSDSRPILLEQHTGTTFVVNKYYGDNIQHTDSCFY